MNRAIRSAEREAIGLKVMTFNIRHGKGIDGNVDLRRIAEQIEKLNPDVVALQEVDRFVPRSGFQDQFRRLSAAIGFYGVFSPSLRIGFSQYGNALLSRFPIVARQTSYLPGVERRSVLIAQIRLDAATTLAMGTTHLGILQREREPQMRRLLSIIAPLQQPAVLAGDFNMGSGNRLLGLFPDHWRRVELPEQFPTTVYGATIDHCFVNIPGVQVSAHVEPTNVSDHYPVLVELKWSSPLFNDAPL